MNAPLGLIGALYLISAVVGWFAVRQLLRR
jgi:hypothetical protein